MKEKVADEEKSRELEEIRSFKERTKTKKKSCSCC